MAKKEEIEEVIGTEEEKIDPSVIKIEADVVKESLKTGVEKGPSQQEIINAEKNSTNSIQKSKVITPQATYVADTSNQEEAARLQEQEAIERLKQEELLKQKQVAQALATQQQKDKISAEQALITQQKHAEELKKQEIEATEALKKQKLQPKHQELKQTIKKEKKVKIKKEKIKKEKLPKEAKNNEEGPTKGKIIAIILFFIALFALIYFLPDIKYYLDNRNVEPVEITNGILSCKKSSTTKNLNIDIDADFKFEDKKLTTLEYITTATGTEDDTEELTGIYDECKTLEEETKSLPGISISCRITGSMSVNIQDFDYSEINQNEVTSSYAEAGGIYPKYELGESIFKIQTDLEKADYICEIK